MDPQLRDLELSNPVRSNAVPGSIDQPDSAQRILSRILVVDDDSAILGMLKTCLSQAGHQVDTAESAHEARAKIKADDFRLVLCDIRMPGESGLDLLHHLAPFSPDIAVIMMTGHAEMEVAINSLRDGAFDFLPKPFDLTKLRKVTDRALARQQRLIDRKRFLEQRLEVMARFTEDVHNPVFQINVDGSILYANRACNHLLGEWESSVMKGMIHPSLSALVNRTFEGQSGEREEMTFGGRTYSFSVTKPVDGKFAYVYGYDTTDLKAAQQELLRLKDDAVQLSRTDYLTGLPNRLSFATSVSRFSNPKEGGLTAVVMMDVNKFKQVNDSFGHAAGDCVLVSIAKSIRRILRPTDLVFRWGGDEILMILPDVQSREAVQKYLEDLNQNVTRDVRAEVSLDVSLSSGVAFWPDDGPEIEEVVTKADDALFRNKASSFSGWKIKNDQAKESVDDGDDADLFTRLTAAVRGKEIDVHFQPIVDSRKNACVIVEALARWNTRSGPVSPGRFIPLADSHGLAPSLGNLIIQASIEYLWKLREAGLKIDMAINLSQWQFQESGFANSLLDVLDSNGIDPGLVWLEISEKYPLLSNSLYHNRILHLREAGFKIALDDFGMGFSNLRALVDLPVDMIKIDSGITTFCGTVKGDAIIKSIAKLADDMDILLAVEGVETKEQLAHLKGLGASLFQGFFFHRPATDDDLLAYLKKSGL